MKIFFLIILSMLVIYNNNLLCDELYTWGRNNYQQLGTTDSNFRNSPAQIGIIQDWVEISTGFHHTVAIKKDGTIWSWGRNMHGELGDNTVIDRSEIRQVGFDNDWSKIFAFRGSTLALKKDGSLWGWGWNEKGELGDGTLVNKLTPTRIGSDVDWLKIVAKYDHVLALKKNGTLWAWGKNDKGQLGDGTLTDRTTPVQVGTDNNWLDFSAGQYSSIAIKNDGTLWAWGSADSYFFSTEDNVNKIKPFKLDSINKWLKVTSGQFHLFALRSDSTIWGWGNNSEGQLGLGGEMYHRMTKPQLISTEKDWVSFSCGTRHSLALKKDGRIWSCGRNTYGELGLGIDGSPNYRDKFTQIGTMNNWTHISAGFEFSVALYSSGKTLATVVVNQITDMTPQLVTIESSILSEGNELVTEKGICWSTTPNPTIDDNKTIDGKGYGKFTSKIEHFQQDTKYFVRSYAINAQGIAYSQQIYFINSSTLPNLATKDVTEVKVKNAKSGGFIFNEGTKKVIRRGVCWSIYPEPTIEDYKSIDGDGTGAFESNIYNLKHNTKYYTRAYAENENGTSYGLAKEFKTKLEAPTLIYPANKDTGIVYEPVFLWSIPEGVKKYRLQIVVDSSFSLNPIYNITIFNGIVDTNFFKKDIYSSRYQTIYWRVSSIFGSDTSEWSEVFRFKPAVPNSVMEQKISPNDKIVKSISYSNSEIIVNYTLPFDCNFSMKLYDLNGQIASEPEKYNMKLSGDYDQIINMKNLNSGLYLLILRINNYTETQKIILLN